MFKTSEYSYFGLQAPGLVVEIVLVVEAVDVDVDSVEDVEVVDVEDVDVEDVDVEVVGVEDVEAIIHTIGPGKKVLWRSWQQPTGRASPGHTAGS